MASYGVSIANVFELLDDEAPAKPQQTAAATEHKRPAQPKPAQESRPQQSNDERGSYAPRGGRGGSRGGSDRGGDRGGRGGGSRGGRGGRGGFSGDRDFSTITAVDGDVSAGGYSHVAGDESSPNARAGRGGNGRGRGFGGRGRGFGDGSRREFDRRGAPRGRGPHEFRKGGIGLGNPTEIVEADAELGQNAEPIDESAATGEVAAEPAAEEEAPAEDLSAIEEVNFVPEDTSMSYDEFLAQQREKAVAEDDLSQRLRSVEIDDKQWKAVKVLNSGKVEETISEEEAEAARQARAAKKAKGKVSLDEFVGSPVGAAPASRRNDDDSEGGRGGSRGGRGGSRGGDRGGRGGFRGESSGGRGGFRGESSGGRGGFRGESSRGGFRGESSRGGDRGERGGYGRGGNGSYRGGNGNGNGRAGSNVNIQDESAFPALGGK